MTSIAIDGPAGAGKSTVAKAVAARLGYRYVDTGAMYRAIALAAMERGTDAEDDVAELARSVELRSRDGRLLMDGKDVTERIRGADVTAKVSQIAAYPQVRAALVELQRGAAARENVVMEGRDIGSAVLPDASVKVFLDASLEERARRRAAETGEPVADVSEAIHARDSADSRRSTSPLVRAHGAVQIDTTGRSIDDIVAEIVELARAAESAEASSDG